MVKNHQKLIKVEVSEKDPRGYEWSPRYSHCTENPSNLLSLYSLFNREDRGDGKIVTFNDYVRVLIQLSPLSFVETHFYS